MGPEQINLYDNPALDKGDWVGSLRPGMGVRGLFAVVQVTTKNTKAGQPFLSLELRDRTGSIGAVGWDHAAWAERLEAGSVIRLSGSVDEYMGNPQIKLSNLDIVQAEVSPGYFVPEGPQDRDTLQGRLEAAIDGITTPHLRTLLEKVFGDQERLREYLAAPAAKLRHQAYVGGLAEHSLNMADHARHCADYYTELDRDLLITACLLHDIGKIEEYRIDTVIDFTDAGRLEGHIVLGDRLVRRLTDEIPTFPDEARMHLSHLILSHQGRLEYASPVTPKSLEAIVLYALDMLDSRVATWRDIRDRHEGQDRRWSDYDRLDERFWFLGWRPPEEGATHSA